MHHRLPGRRAWLAPIVLAFAAGCSTVESPPNGTGGTGGSGGAAMCDAGTAPAPASDDWCARIVAGPAGVRAVAVDLSAAHAGVRFFGPVTAYGDADQALADALDDPAALTSPDLSSYVASLSGVACALAASPAALGPASVEMAGDVAVVHPGTGGVTIPAGAKAVAVDLRGLPDAPGLRAALEAAVSPALASSVARSRRSVRRHEGLTDEVFSAANVYNNTIEDTAQDPIPASGAADLPIAFLTDARPAPDAAEIAGTLRLAGRGWIFGEGVRSEVAEARWQGVGATGVAYRTGVLVKGSSPWPDEIPADQRTAHPECLLAGLPEKGAPPALAAGAADRPGMVPISPFQQIQPVDASLGAARAALVVAHGAARTFFPYFATVGDTIDARLGETIDALGDGAPADRSTIADAIGRFGNALDDGHNFTTDYAYAPAGYFPVYIEDIAGEPVVRRSLAVGVNAGDTITSIGGVPAATWYQKALAVVGGATDGYRFNLATRRYLSLDGPMAFGLRDPDGNTKTITFQPQPYADYQTLGFAPSLRQAGFLADLGAPTLYYLNMAAEVLSDVDQLHAALTEAAPAAGLVVDMRGYPGVNHAEVAARLIQATFSSPLYRVPILDGPDQRSTEDQPYTATPETMPSYGGPVVLLVGHTTVSAAEDFSLMLVDAKRVKVMGRRSAGTDGNITGVQLPGAFSMSFTGMEVRHADPQESPFHGIGIVPDVESTLTAAAFRDGKDPELLDAIAWLSMGP